MTAHARTLIAWFICGASALAGSSCASSGSEANEPEFGRSLPAASAAPIAPALWTGRDIPCSAGPQALLPALEARVLTRIHTPIGLVPVAIAGGRAAGELLVKMVIEIDRKGSVRRSAVARSSGIFELDRAVTNAIEESVCMPAPPPALVDHTGTVKVSVGYLFRRG